jgi:hypothetical protein
MEPPHLRIVLSPLVEKEQLKICEQQSGKNESDATPVWLKIIFGAENTIPLFVRCLETLSKVSFLEEFAF